MTNTQTLDTLADPVFFCNSDRDLRVIAEASVALAIWQRPVPQSLRDGLTALDLKDVDDLKLTVDLRFSVSALATRLVESNYAKQVVCPLAADILDHARRLSLASGAQHVKLRLEVIETDACRRFHADYVTYRLLTTYLGAGTQWVRAHRPEAVEQLDAGDIAILKGRLLASEPPVLHRSPPIGATGERRLLLAIDPVMRD